MPTKEKEFAYIIGFSSNVYKTILAAEERISTSTAHSYISAMLLALKSLFVVSDEDERRLRVNTSWHEVYSR